MALKDITSARLSGRKVLLRVDFNVPLEESRITDDSRVRAHLETIRFLREAGAKTALLSHLGRPKGKPVPELSLKPLCGKLKELLGTMVPFLEDCISEEVPERLDALEEGGLILLENTRFYPQEEANDPVFSKKLATPFDLFVMDAFSAAHRAHASTRGVADYLPSYAGFLIEKEVRMLEKVRDKPAKPLVIVLGGAKVTDKIGLVENMAEKAAVVLVGGAMAFPFMKAEGLPIGRSKCDAQNTEKARYILQKTAEKNVELVLPVDFVVSDAPEHEREAAVARAASFPEEMMGLDIGPATREVFARHIDSARSVLWNGPMGVFERPAFSEGTKAVGEAISKQTKRGAITILGGGDTAAAAYSLGFADAVTHVSTGGGASLEFFEGKTLPGLEPLYEREEGRTAE
ncbi:MAG: phosphoglycerate kinase [Thermovirgaceae bacterium]